MRRLGLDLGGVGPALAEPGGESVPAAVGAKSRDAGAFAGGEHDLGDAGDGERAALPGPDGPGVAAAHVEPRGDEVAGAAGQRGVADFVALAVQADLAGVTPPSDSYGYDPLTQLTAATTTTYAYD